jgi:type VI protein secretion system component Hcp
MLGILTSYSVKQSGGNETMNEQMSILYTCIHIDYKSAQETTGMRHLLHSYIIGFRRMDK